MKKLALISLAAAATLNAGGYKIPEASLNAMALSAAYVANAHGADASYYNPANMAFDTTHAIELDATYIGLTGIDFDGSVDGSPRSSIGSETESFLVPSLHYISPKMGNVTLGLSIVVPGGLSKRWHDQPGQSYAKEFTLQVVEINPTIAYKLNDVVAIGGGLRVVHSSGIVQSQSIGSRDMEGESYDYGYNLAIAYKPSKQWSFAATYRSNVDLSEVGTAKLYFPDNADYSGPVEKYDAQVSVPLPAALNLAAAYHFENGTTLEAVYERTFWSAYKELDFEYDRSIGALTGNFDDPIAKDWNDVNTYRVGVTQQYESWTAMAAVAYDETPVPEETLNFELPDSNAWVISMGGRYQIDAHWNVGAAALVDLKENRSINDNDTGIDGAFSNARAYLFTLGAGYTF